MYDSVQIAGYRGFERFEMDRLGRVNLLVGGNSSGKTSVLEALYILAWLGDPAALATVLWRRGERFPEMPDRRSARLHLDAAHLFTGHAVGPGSSIALRSKRSGFGQETMFSFARVSVREASPLEGFDDDDAEALGPVPVLRLSGRPAPPIEVIRLTDSGGMLVRRSLVQRRALARVAPVPAEFITTESLGSDDLVPLWDKLALTASEELVLRALRFVEPAIERIAAQSGESFAASSRGGFIVRLAGQDTPVPIGSLGDGIWRMLALAIEITQCAGGILLVDEIDTGLHYTVLSDMWRLIFGAAKELDVQVFATTHSYDCIQSLAALCVSDADATNHVTLQRIEAGKPRAVMYTEREIEQAAARNIEVR